MNWKRASLNRNTSIYEAIKNLEKTAIQIVLVVDSKNNFLGTLTDGDIRKGVLKGLKLSTPIDKLMNKKPIFVKNKILQDDAFEIMKKYSINHLPIIKKKK